MRSSTRPYAPPRKLERALARVLDFWNGLKRREAKIPFWDDVKLSALEELAATLTMIDVLPKPARFHFAAGVVGEEIKRRYGGDLVDMFLDDIEIRYPFQFLISQCSATLESGTPTYYRHSEARDARLQQAFSRLLLPLWGDGRIGMLLGAFAWQ